MINVDKISFVAASANDYDDFNRLRKSLWRSIGKRIDRWHEGRENTYNEASLKKGGLRKIFYHGEPVGYIGVAEKDRRFELESFCIERQYQKKGLGAAVLDRILAEPQILGKRVRLQLLTRLPLRTLYKKAGFKLVVGRQKKLTTYARFPSSRVRRRSLKQEL